MNTDPVAPPNHTPRCQARWGGDADIKKYHDCRPTIRLRSGRITRNATLRTRVCTPYWRERARCPLRRERTHVAHHANRQGRPEHRAGKLTEHAGAPHGVLNDRPDFSARLFAQPHQCADIDRPHDTHDAPVPPRGAS